MRKPKRTILMTFAGAVCAVGLLLAGHGYFLLGAVEDALKTQQALDDSLLAALRAGTIVKDQAAGAANAITDHVTHTTTVRRAVSEVTASVRLGQMVAAALWAAALALTLTSLRRSGTSIGGADSST